MNWMGGGTKRLRQKPTRKIQEEFFSRRRFQMAHEDNLQDIRSADIHGHSQDLMFLQILMDKPENRAPPTITHVTIKTPAKRRCNGIYKVDLPDSPIQVPSRLQLLSPPSPKTQRSRVPDGRRDGDHDPALVNYSDARIESMLADFKPVGVSEKATQTDAPASIDAGTQTDDLQTTDASS